MEQLLIQATILRAKRLARRLQDARATTGIAEENVPSELNCRNEQDEKHSTQAIFSRSLSNPTKNNPFYSSSLSSNPFKNLAFDNEERCCLESGLQIRGKGKKPSFNKKIKG